MAGLSSFVAMQDSTNAGRYTLQEVQTAADATIWRRVAHAHYRSDPTWVAPLDEDLEKIFNQTKNPAFGDGEAIRWILFQDNQPVGRIAAHYQRGKAAKYDRPVGGFGFLETPNDPVAANLLLDTAKAWLQARGMVGMDGPANFGENDRYAGLLVDGYTQPSFGMNYNPAYYETILTDYGFAKYYDQVSMVLQLGNGIPERFKRAYEWVMRKPGVQITHATRKDLDRFARDFQTIYNDAWQHHLHFTPITDEKAMAMAKELRPVLLQKMMVFSYVDGEPAGILLTLPDLNQIFKPLKGHFPLWQKLLFLLRSRNDFAWYRNRGILNRGRTIIVGVRPKFQKMGLDVGMVAWVHPHSVAYGLKEVELGWVGDWNPLSRALQSGSGAQPGKVHRTYRIWFDGAEVQPMTSVSG